MYALQETGFPAGRFLFFACRGLNDIRKFNPCGRTARGIKKVYNGVTISIA